MRHNINVTLILVTLQTLHSNQLGYNPDIRPFYAPKPIVYPQPIVHSSPEPSDTTQNPTQTWGTQVPNLLTQIITSIQPSQQTVILVDKFGHTTPSNGETQKVASEAEDKDDRIIFPDSLKGMEEDKIHTQNVTQNTANNTEYLINHTEIYNLNVNTGELSDRLEILHANSENKHNDVLDKKNTTILNPPVDQILNYTLCNSKKENTTTENETKINVLALNNTKTDIENLMVSSDKNTNLNVVNDEINLETSKLETINGTKPLTVTEKNNLDVTHVPTKLKPETFSEENVDLETKDPESFTPEYITIVVKDDLGVTTSAPKFEGVISDDINKNEDKVEANKKDQAEKDVTEHLNKLNETETKEDTFEDKNLNQQSNDLIGTVEIINKNDKLELFNDGKEVTTNKLIDEKVVGVQNETGQINDIVNTKITEKEKDVHSNMNDTIEPTNIDMHMELSQNKKDSHIDTHEKIENTKIRDNNIKDDHRETENKTILSENKPVISNDKVSENANNDQAKQIEKDKTNSGESSVLKPIKLEQHPILDENKTISQLAEGIVQNTNDEIDDIKITEIDLEESSHEEDSTTIIPLISSNLDLEIDLELQDVTKIPLLSLKDLISELQNGESLSSSKDDKEETKWDHKEKEQQNIKDAMDKEVNFSNLHQNNTNSFLNEHSQFHIINEENSNSSLKEQTKEENVQNPVSHLDITNGSNDISTLQDKINSSIVKDTPNIQNEKLSTSVEITVEPDQNPELHVENIQHTEQNDIMLGVSMPISLVNKTQTSLLSTEELAMGTHTNMNASVEKTPLLHDDKIENVPSIDEVASLNNGQQNLQVQKEKQVNKNSVDKIENLNGPSHDNLMPNESSIIKNSANLSSNTEKLVDSEKKNKNSPNIPSDESNKNQQTVISTQNKPYFENPVDEESKTNEKDLTLLVSGLGQLLEKDSSTLEHENTTQKIEETTQVQLDVVSMMTYQVPNLGYKPVRPFYASGFQHYPQPVIRETTIKPVQFEEVNIAGKPSTVSSNVPDLNYKPSKPFYASGFQYYPQLITNTPTVKPIQFEEITEGKPFTVKPPVASSNVPNLNYKPSKPFYASGSQQYPQPITNKPTMKPMEFEEDTEEGKPFTTKLPTVSSNVPNLSYKPSKPFYASGFQHYPQPITNKPTIKPMQFEEVTEEGKPFTIKPTMVSLNIPDLSSKPSKPFFASDSQQYPQPITNKPTMKPMQFEENTEESKPFTTKLPVSSNVPNLSYKPSKPFYASGSQQYPQPVNNQPTMKPMEFEDITDENTSTTLKPVVVSSHVPSLGYNPSKPFYASGFQHHPQPVEELTSSSSKPNMVSSNVPDLSYKPSKPSYASGFQHYPQPMANKPTGKPIEFEESTHVSTSEPSMVSSNIPSLSYKPSKPFYASGSQQYPQPTISKPTSHFEDVEVQPSTVKPSLIPLKPSLEYAPIKPFYAIVQQYPLPTTAQNNLKPAEAFSHSEEYVGPFLIPNGLNYAPNWPYSLLNLNDQKQPSDEETSAPVDKETTLKPVQMGSQKPFEKQTKDTTTLIPIQSSQVPSLEYKPSQSPFAVGTLQYSKPTTEEQGILDSQIAEEEMKTSTLKPESSNVNLEYNPSEPPFAGGDLEYLQPNQEESSASKEPIEEETKETILKPTQSSQIINLEYKPTQPPFAGEDLQYPKPNTNGETLLEDKLEETKIEISSPKPSESPQVPSLEYKPSRPPFAGGDLHYPHPNQEETIAPDNQPTKDVKGTTINPTESFQVPNLDYKPSQLPFVGEDLQDPKPNSAEKAISEKQPAQDEIKTSTQKPIEFSQVPDLEYKPNRPGFAGGDLQYPKPNTEEIVIPEYQPAEKESKTSTLKPIDASQVPSLEYEPSQPTFAGEDLQYPRPHQEETAIPEDQQMGEEIKATTIKPIHSSQVPSLEYKPSQLSFPGGDLQYPMPNMEENISKNQSTEEETKISALKPLETSEESSSSAEEKTSNSTLRLLEPSKIQNTNYHLNSNLNNNHVVENGSSTIITESENLNKTGLKPQAIPMDTKPLDALTTNQLTKEDNIYSNINNQVANNIIYRPGKPFFGHSKPLDVNGLSEDKNEALEINKNESIAHDETISNKPLTSKNKDESNNGAAQATIASTIEESNLNGELSIDDQSVVPNEPETETTVIQSVDNHIISAVSKPIEDNIAVEDKVVLNSKPLEKNKIQEKPIGDVHLIENTLAKDQTVNKLIDNQSKFEWEESKLEHKPNSQEIPLMAVELPLESNSKQDKLEKEDPLIEVKPTLQLLDNKSEEEKLTHQSIGNKSVMQIKPQDELVAAHLSEGSELLEDIPMIKDQLLYGNKPVVDSTSDDKSAIVHMPVLHKEQTDFKPSAEHQVPFLTQPLLHDESVVETKPVMQDKPLKDETDSQNKPTLGDKPVSSDQLLLDNKPINQYMHVVGNTPLDLEQQEMEAKPMVQDNPAEEDKLVEQHILIEKDKSVLDYVLENITMAKDKPLENITVGLNYLVLEAKPVIPQKPIEADLVHEKPIIADTPVVLQQVVKEHKPAAEGKPLLAEILLIQNEEMKDKPLVLNQLVLPNKPVIRDKVIDNKPMIENMSTTAHSVLGEPLVQDKVETAETHAPKVEEKPILENKVTIGVKPAMQTIDSQVLIDNNLQTKNPILPNKLIETNKPILGEMPIENTQVVSNIQLEIKKPPLDAKLELLNQQEESHPLVPEDNPVEGNRPIIPNIVKEQQKPVPGRKQAIETKPTILSKPVENKATEGDEVSEEIDTQVTWNKKVEDKMVVENKPALEDIAMIINEQLEQKPTLNHKPENEEKVVIPNKSTEDDKIVVDDYPLDKDKPTEDDTIVMSNNLEKYSKPAIEDKPAVPIKLVEQNKQVLAHKPISENKPTVSNKSEFEDSLKPQTERLEEDKLQQNKPTAEDTLVTLHDTNFNNSHLKPTSSEASKVPVVQQVKLPEVPSTLNINAINIKPTPEPSTKPFPLQPVYDTSILHHTREPVISSTSLNNTHVVHAVLPSKPEMPINIPSKPVIKPTTVKPISIKPPSKPNNKPVIKPSNPVQKPMVSTITQESFHDKPISQQQVETMFAKPLENGAVVSKPVKPLDENIAEQLYVEPLLQNSKPTPKPLSITNTSKPVSQNTVKPIVQMIVEPIHTVLSADNTAPAQKPMITTTIVKPLPEKPFTQPPVEDLYSKPLKNITAIVHTPVVQNSHKPLTVEQSQHNTKPVHTPTATTTVKPKPQYQSSNSHLVNQKPNLATSISAEPLHPQGVHKPIKPLVDNHPDLPYIEASPPNTINIVYKPTFVSKPIYNPDSHTQSHKPSLSYSKPIFNPSESTVIQAHKPGLSYIEVKPIRPYHKPQRPPNKPVRPLNGDEHKINLHHLLEYMQNMNKLNPDKFKRPILPAIMPVSLDINRIVDAVRPLFTTPSSLNSNK